MDLFRGKTLLKKDGTTISADGALRNKRLICIYFAAQWCPPCRVFTPLLANAYRRAKDEGLPIEVVFVSSDRSGNDMSAYVKSDHEDWPALPYGDALQAGLRARYKGGRHTYAGGGQGGWCTRVRQRQARRPDQGLQGVQGLAELHMNLQRSPPEGVATE
ncbi:hypothetical protein MTO96_047899 [Rhipicephalus appendiculatus]